ncbi:hypothetical protein AB0G04_17435 [Actinoplanes sp. NPDC023801]|uniref:hypothetical protein n=1 Tax=Actinoplanes sp. NPDC023801 TaxID=3154595 RepID=UPI0033E21F1D
MRADRPEITGAPDPAGLPTPAGLPDSTERAARPDCPSLCLVCGFDYRDQPPADWPWGPAGTDPSFGFCVCCGTEFGYADATLAGSRRARKAWAEGGHRWHDPAARSENFDPAEQLKALPDRIR